MRYIIASIIMMSVQGRTDGALYERFWKTITVSQIECVSTKCYAIYRFNLEKHTVTQLQDSKHIVCQTKQYEFPINTKNLYNCISQPACKLTTSNTRYSRTVLHSCQQIEKALKVL